MTAVGRLTGGQCADTVRSNFEHLYSLQRAVDKLNKLLNTKPQPIG